MLRFRKKEKMLHFKEDGNVGLLLSKRIENNFYMIKETPLFIESKLYEYGTVVATQKENDGKLWITNIVSKSAYKTEVYCLNKEIIKSKTFKALSNKLIEIGGSFDIAMGGVVSIYIPKNIDFNINKIVNELLKEND